jgi:hypothetical protein
MMSAMSGDVHRALAGRDELDLAALPVAALRLPLATFFRPWRGTTNVLGQAG